MWHFFNDCKWGYWQKKNHVIHFSLLKIILKSQRFLLYFEGYYIAYLKNFDWISKSFRKNIFSNCLRVKRSSFVNELCCLQLFRDSYFLDFFFFHLPPLQSTYVSSNVGDGISNFLSLNVNFNVLRVFSQTR